MLSDPSQVKIESMGVNWPIWSLETLIILWLGICTLINKKWQNIGVSDHVLGWIKHGVNIFYFFAHFKGKFIDRIRNGSLHLVGKKEECQPQYLVMPLPIESSKPKLCHDERFLNLWIKESPFVLDTLRDIPRLVPKESFITTSDDKSEYDHIFLTEQSRKYFGLQFGGWFMCYKTIHFGLKAGVFIYHTVGLAATSYVRSLGVPCSQYIDDRWIGEWLCDQVAVNLI
ncbi:hypothetical protein KUTeg_022447 [Tegillarca granosa]|uniref:Uncharacterized protein n=1 Tax=Tegillarca granosa TaxID=220873 RepID=A0ABQ9ECE7_TEGGR|nr:hypothetical protein KUTeg_022447 [Tegillarca granosa]